MSRQRTYFSSAELPHIWANCREFPAHGRCSASMSFSGVDFYSYATQIAKRLNPNTDREAVLLNVTGYSVSTSRHQRAVLSALRSGLRVFEVSGLSRGNVLDEFERHPSRVYRNLVERVESTLTKARNARSNAPFWAERARQLIEQANQANAYFSLGLATLTLEGVSSVLATLSERERAEAARIAEEQRQREEKRNAEAAETLTLWRAGEPVYSARFSNLPVALRVKTDDEGREIVETSHGARVLLSSALTLFRVCAVCKRTSSPWTHYGERFAVGPYDLRSIDAEGNAQVGCHALPFAEMERLYRSLSSEQIARADRKEWKEVSHA